MHFVYAIECASKIKIGVSQNPDARLRELQVGSPKRLTLVDARDFTWREQALAVEKGIHLELAKQHESGEWFRKHPVDPLRWLNIYHNEHLKLLEEGFYADW